MNNLSRDPAPSPAGPLWALLAEAAEELERANTGPAVVRLARLLRPLAVLGLVSGALDVETGDDPADIGEHNNRVMPAWTGGKLIQDEVGPYLTKRFDVADILKRIDEVHDLSLELDPGAGATIGAAEEKRLADGLAYLVTDISTVLQTIGNDETVMPPLRALAFNVIDGLDAAAELYPNPRSGGPQFP